MGLSAQKYNEIMRGYDSRKTDAESTAIERRQQIYKAIPEYKECDDLIADTSIESASLILMDDAESEGTIQSLREKIKTLSDKKASLLKAAGYTLDYLDVHYNCPDCKDTGYIDGKKCHCLLLKITDELYEQSHIKSVLSKENFTSFTYKYYNDAEKAFMENVVSDAHVFIDTFDEVSRNLLFFGDTGCGKTFLSNCIAKELLDSGHSVIYFNAYQLFDILAQNAFKRDIGGGEARAFLEDILSCDLLVLDDLGSEAANSYTISQLFLILNERQQRNVSTIISTNLNIQQMNDLYSERSISRILGNYNIYHFQGGDIRQRKRATLSVN